MNILITGATGFIGKPLINKLQESIGYELTALLRSESALPTKSIILDDPKPNNLIRILKNIDVVIHLAARVHVMNESVMDPLSEFRKVNVGFTLDLAQAAVDAGVRRFIFLSTIKVNGEFTKPLSPFTANEMSTQSELQGFRSTHKTLVDPYALSKLEAENGLIKICRNSDLDLVIIRPPLVYGSGVKGNFQKMLQWIYDKRPLPFGKVMNQRSLVYIDNLISLIETCIVHPKAANEIFLVSDRKDLSISKLIRTLASIICDQNKMINIHPIILRLFFLILRKNDTYHRLCCNLQVDVQKTCDLLNWTPPISVEDGLVETAKSWLEKNQRK